MRPSKEVAEILEVIGQSPSRPATSCIIEMI